MYRMDLEVPHGWDLLIHYLQGLIGIHRRAFGLRL